MRVRKIRMVVTSRLWYYSIYIGPNLKTHECDANCDNINIKTCWGSNLDFRIQWNYHNSNRASLTRSVRYWIRDFFANYYVQLFIIILMYLINEQDNATIISKCFRIFKICNRYFVYKQRFQAWTTFQPKRISHTHISITNLRNSRTRPNSRSLLPAPLLSTISLRDFSLSQFSNKHGRKQSLFTHRHTYNSERIRGIGERGL